MANDKRKIEKNRVIYCKEMRIGKCNNVVALLLIFLLLLLLRKMSNLWIENRFFCCTIFILKKIIIISSNQLYLWHILDFTYSKNHTNNILMLSVLNKLVVFNKIYIREYEFIGAKSVIRKRFFFISLIEINYSYSVKE